MTFLKKINSKQNDFNCFTDKKRKWTRSPIPNQETICNGKLPREEKISFLQWGDIGYISHTLEQASYSRIVFQYKMHFMFECDFFCYRLVGFCLLGILFVLFSCWIFLVGVKRKNMKMNCGGS